MQPSAEPAPYCVLMVSDDPHLIERCRLALEPSQVELCIFGTQMSPQRQLEVIVVAGPLPPASRHGESMTGASIPPGIIALGDCAAVADVVLPLDFLPRELLTACRLLGDNCRLRHQLAEGQATGTRLLQEAFRDPLTQLPNRRAWEAELAVRLAHNTATPLCLALVDIDHLKQVNDGWGHVAGDQLLVATGSALRQSLRQDDFIARLGGDEFGLLLAGLDRDAAQRVLERVQAGLPASIATSSRQVTSVSIGYACSPAAAGVSGERLTQAADEARRQAKQQGRNRVVAGSVD